jgi:hypothetical protein
MKATIVSGWKGTGTYADPFRPAVVDDHGLTQWTMTSNAKGGVGNCPVEVETTRQKIDAIKADPKYAGKVTEPGAEQERLRK